MNRALAKILDARRWTRAATDGIKNIQKVLKEHTFMNTNKGACVKARRELHKALARYT